MNLSKAVDKAYEGKSFKELANAPVEALQGLSAGDAKLLLEAFHVKTIADLARLKYFRWAEAIVTLAEMEA
jgi:hypothetical protein